MSTPVRKEKHTFFRLDRVSSRGYFKAIF